MQGINMYKLINQLFLLYLLFIGIVPVLISQDEVDPLTGKEDLAGSN
jgi:hypothetical protein